MTAIKRSDKNESPTVRKVHNKTGLPLETIEALPVLFTVKNNWRQRDVVVHRHPHKPGKLLTVGYWFDGSTVNACEEDDKDYARELEELPWKKHFVYD